LVSLEILDLSQNRLEGLIPTEGFYNWTSLIVFSAHSNNFSGTLPSSLANCTKLLVLNLRKNRFTGELPPYIANFGNLQVLNVGYNNLHGSVPQWITNLTKLFVLDLSNNKFSGRIPYDLERLQGFAINRSSQGFQYYYEMIVDIKGIEYNMPYVWKNNVIFDLSMNNITGEIPISIGSMNSLRLLNLSMNQLEGKIPACLSDISTLEELNIAKNKLHGEIPQVKFVC
jgi:Leucine-rich repeat (LRR) protein